MTSEHDISNASSEMDMFSRIPLVSASDMMVANESFIHQTSVENKNSGVYGLMTWWIDKLKVSSICSMTEPNKEEQGRWMQWPDLNTLWTPLSIVGIATDGGKHGGKVSDMHPDTFCWSPTKQIDGGMSKQVPYGNSNDCANIRYLMHLDLL